MGTELKDLKRIIDGAGSVTLLGNGAANEADLRMALAAAPLLVCADGGGNRALEWGFAPAALIGDMDSFDAKNVLDSGIGLVQVEDQNSTDFEKCLSLVPAELVLCVGFLGRRMDHQIVALNALCKYPDRRIILVGDEDIVLRVPRKMEFSLKEGVRVSLFALTDAAARGTGLKWAINGLDFSPLGLNGCSNAATGGVISIEILSGNMLLVLPKENLAAVL